MCECDKKNQHSMVWIRVKTARIRLFMCKCNKYGIAYTPVDKAAIVVKI